MNIKGIWIKHPRTGEPDTMLTLATLATMASLFKFLLNGVTITLLNQSFNFGVIDSSLIGAILLPTLGAYVGRKITDSPDKILKSIGITKDNKEEL